jgi:hypothetical protein
MRKLSFYAAVLSAIVLVPIEEDAQSRSGYTLTVKVLDVKGSSCNGQTRYMPGAAVRLKQGTTVLHQGTSDSNGRVIFSNVAAGAYTINASANYCNEANVTYQMPGQPAEISVSLDNCATTASYDLVSTLKGDPKIPQAGKNYLLSLSVRNNGPGAPSKSGDVSIYRYSVMPGGRVSNQGVRIETIKKLPALCSGESVAFTFTDRNVPAGAYVYKLTYAAPMNDANNNNHRPEMQVTVVP